MNVFSAVTKKYSTCIVFVPSEVTIELVNTIEEHGIHRADMTPFGESQRGW
jgi:hypothetical protein